MSSNLSTGNSNSYVYITTTNLGTVNWSSYPYYGFLDNGELLIKLFAFMQDDDITNLLRFARDGLDTNDFNEIVSFIVSKRHFSEEFLLEFVSNPLNKKDIIFKMHSADIRSGKYSELALLFELNK